jgi:hypothetical protein
MGRDLLGVLNGAAIFQISRDAGGPKGVTTDIRR